MSPVRVLIADDEAVVREGLRSYLDDSDEIDVVAEATSGPQAVDLARKHGVDLVLMDVRMPGGDGVAATRELAGPDTDPRIRVVVITVFDIDEYIFGAIDSGASGVVLKNAKRDELVTAVLTVARGDGYLSPTLTLRTFAEFARRNVPVVNGPLLDDVGLTVREAEILRAFARGMTNDQLSEKFTITKGTVKTHLDNIKKKTGLKHRRELTYWALRNGLG